MGTGFAIGILRIIKYIKHVQRRNKKKKINNIL